VLIKRLGALETPTSSTPLYPSAGLSPLTTNDGSSPAISSLAPSPDTVAGKWDPLHGRMSELEGSEVLIHNRKSELYGSDVINVGCQPRNSLLSPASSPYNNPNTYTGGGTKYPAYRPG
jgi:hypothetical protein